MCSIMLHSKHSQTKLCDGITVYVKKVGIFSYINKELFALRVKDVDYHSKGQCLRGWYGL